MWIFLLSKLFQKTKRDRDIMNLLDDDNTVTTNTRAPLAVSSSSSSGRRTTQQTSSTRRSFADDHSSGSQRVGGSNYDYSTTIYPGDTGTMTDTSSIAHTIFNLIQTWIPEQYKDDFIQYMDYAIKGLKILGIIVIFMCVASTISTILYLIIQFCTTRGTTTYTRVHLHFPLVSPSSNIPNNIDINDGTGLPTPLLLPVARGNITLGDYKDQWTYSEYISFLPFKHRTYTNTLKVNTKYQIDTIFRIAKSPRNQEIGKVMVKMNLLADTTSELIATSSRPLIVPFAPMIELTLRSALLVIPRMIVSALNIGGGSSSHVTGAAVGNQWTDHYDTVVLNMFNDYEEVTVMGFRTKYIELILSNPEIDVAETLIRISTQGGWFSRYVVL